MVMMDKFAILAGMTLYVERERKHKGKNNKHV
jgi:hypothetical protein